MGKYELSSFAKRDNEIVVVLPSSSNQVAWGRMLLTLDDAAYMLKSLGIRLCSNDITSNYRRADSLEEAYAQLRGILSLAPLSVGDWIFFIPPTEPEPDTHGWIEHRPGVFRLDRNARSYRIALTNGGGARGDHKIEVGESTVNMELYWECWLVVDGHASRCPLRFFNDLLEAKDAVEEYDEELERAKDMAGRVGG